MGQLFGFGGGGDPPKQPKANQTAEAEAAMRRRRAQTSGYRSTILSEMYGMGEKSKLGQ